MAFELSRARHLMAASEQANFATPNMEQANYGRPGFTGRMQTGQIKLFGNRVLTNRLVQFASPTDSMIADTEGYVTRGSGGVILVAFRGSEPPAAPGSLPTRGLMDWIISDGMAMMVPYPSDFNALGPNTFRSTRSFLSALSNLAAADLPKMVHAGFLMAYFDVHAQVRALVQRAFDAAPDTSKIFVTGHSLGGAVAVHAAADLARQFPGVRVRLYTFGAPRTGNILFEKYVQQVTREMYHVINSADPVAFVPPVGPRVGPHFLRYARAAETWFIKRGIIRPNVPKGTLGFNPMRPTSFTPHLPCTYIDALHPRNVTFRRQPRATAMS